MLRYYILWEDVLKYITAALLCTGILTPAALPSPSVANLRDDETLKIEYRSSGCFHQDRNSLTLSRDVVIVDDRQSLPLTHQMKRSLDTYFHALDLGEFHGCTTVEYLDISLIREGETVSTWEYMDGSCGSIFRPTSRALPAGTDWSSALTMGSLIHKVENPDWEIPKRELVFGLDEEGVY